jgi:hypothetical protein
MKLFHPGGVFCDAEGLFDYVFPELLVDPDREFPPLYALDGLRLTNFSNVWDSWVWYPGTDMPLGDVMSIGANHPRAGTL